MKRMMKTIYVEEEDETRIIDQILMLLNALGSTVDHDQDWEEVPDIFLDENPDGD